MINYFARPGQPLHTHLENVAQLAGKFGLSVGLYKEAHLAGSLHDLGKYRSEFQDYLRGDRASSAETQHAAYGAVWAIDRNQLLQAFVIAGHHAGLHDLADLQGIPFKSVLGLPESLETALQRYLTEACPPDILSEPEFLTITSDPAEQALRIDFAVRMLFSCLVDADRLDSAFWPLAPPEDRLFNAFALLERVEAERQRKAGNSPDSPLKSSRNQIFDTCLVKAQCAQGFFSLTVPTGGGKTLSAMAFALAHARKHHNLRRIIVVIPYLSVTIQVRNSLACQPMRI